MTRTRLQSILIVFALSCAQLYAELPNWTRNDQYPIFSSYYPYGYLATRQIANLMRFDYTYTPARFRVSISGYTQFANRARDSEKNVINIGDINGRWNMLGLFYDPVMRTTLFNALGINQTATVCDPNPGTVPTGDNTGPNTTPNTPNCLAEVIDPKLVDPNQEFGFFSLRGNYRKNGVRFESDLLLIDRCYYGVGLRIQWGIADVRQTILHFEDFTNQALGVTAPAALPGVFNVNSDSVAPTPPRFVGVTPPFVDPVNQPPCPGSGPFANPDAVQNCVTDVQPFTPCVNQQVCFSFSGQCKQFVEQSIMKQKDLIANALNLDINNYHKTGLDDLRLLLWYRHIYIINEDDEYYPRSLIMPFAEVGVGIPMEKAQPLYKPFAVPVGNNNHTYVGGTVGFTVNFLDTIDIIASGGFSYFFPRIYCNYRLPTNTSESGIFPYTADINLRPGMTWYGTLGMHAWHFIDNLSTWAEFVFVNHAQDKITICRSYIPSNSCYFAQGFLVEDAEAFSKWESVLFNIGFNYDISNNISLGAAWQGPVRQRNTYRQATFMGTISLVF